MMTPAAAIEPIGVPDFGLTYAKNFGNRPSWAIANSTRVRPKYMTRMTVVRPAIAPLAMMPAAVVCPTCTSAEAPGAGDRTSVVEGKSVSVRVDLGGSGIIKKKKKKKK